MKKWSLLLLLFLLVSCGQPTAVENPTAVPTAQPEAEPTATHTAVPDPTADPTDTAVPPTAEPTIVPTATAVPQFTFSSHFGGGPAGQWDRDNWETFLTSYPDLNANIRTTDYYRAFVNRAIHNELTGDDPADVYGAAMGGALVEYVEQGIIADISDLWQEQGWDDEFPASVKAMATVNGRQYFVPQAIQWNGIFYRTDVMAEAGVEPPTSWEELLAACDALNTAGITPFVMTATSRWPPPMGFWFTHINQRLNGPDFHEQLMRGQISYTDPRVRAIFDYYGQLFEHNCFEDGATNIGYSQAIDKFENGDGAMYAHGEWLYEFINDETKAVTDLIRFPIIDETVPLGELVPMYGAFMTTNTEYPEIAREFLIFVGNEASQQSNMESIRRLPSNLNVDRSSLLPVYEKGLQLVTDGTILTQLIGANTDPTVASELLTTISRFWQAPEDIDALLENVEADRQAAYGDVE